MPPNPTRTHRRRLSNRTVGAFCLALATLLAVALTSGVLDPWLLPRLPATGDGHADGRIPVPGEPTAQTSALDLTGARTATLARFVTAGLGLAPLPTVALPLPDGRTLTCTDLTRSLPGHGDPAGWEKSGPIQHITIHSAGVDGDTDPYAVANYHVMSLGWDHIGYGWVVRRTGDCAKTLPDGTLVFAQLLGNPGDQAVMLSGQRDYPPAQLATLTDLTVALAARYGVPPAGVKFHCDWSLEDQAAVRAGTWAHAASLVNNHVDPHLRLSDCVGSDHFGLRDVVAASRSASTPAPPAALGSYPVPSLVTLSKVAAGLTYYLPTGRPAASGTTYDGKAHTMATYLLTRDQLADDDPRVRDCHVSPTLGTTVCPAYPWGTVFRLCRADNPSRCSRAAITDTGLLDPERERFDASPTVFGELGNLREGRIQVVATLVGFTSIDGLRPK